jgi:hypothetical protein
MLANNRTETNPAITPRLQSEAYWRGVVYPKRSACLASGTAARRQQE